MNLDLKQTKITCPNCDNPMISWLDKDKIKYIVKGDKCSRCGISLSILFRHYSIVQIGQVEVEFIK